MAKQRKLKKKSKPGKKQNIAPYLITIVVAALLIYFLPKNIGRIRIDLGALFKKPPKIENVPQMPLPQIPAPVSPAPAKAKPKVPETGRSAPGDHFDYYKGSLIINGNIHRFLHGEGFSRDRVEELNEEKKEGEKRFLYTTWSFEVPQEGDLPGFTAKLKAVISESGGRIEDAHTYLIRDKEIITFYVSIYDEVTHFVSVFRKIKTPIEGEGPVIAVIIDDCGYLPPEKLHYLKGKENLVLAVMPYTPYCGETVEFATNNGNEIILHQPFEPEDLLQAKEKGMLRSSDEPAALAKVLGENFHMVNAATGFNNHKGSKATAAPELMARVMKYARERGLFFVDSRTSSKSIAYETAKALGVPAIKRDVFLDNEAKEAYIIGQFHNLFRIAYLKGYAVGICHFKESTLKVLEKAFDEINALGIRIVPVSYIIENEASLNKNGTKELPDKLKKMMSEIEED